MAIDITGLIDRLQRRGFSQELIRDITAASQEVVDAQENQFDSSRIDEVRAHFERMNQLLEQNRSTLQETLDVNAELQSNYDSERGLLMEIIDEEIASGDLSSQRLKMAQERIKELAKLNKSIENYNAGMEKGEAAAKEILQATIGLSTEWSMLSSKSGIQGMGKGFVGSLKSLMSPMNLLIALAQKVFERAVAYDKASADLFKRTGLDSTMVNLKNIATNLKGMSTELQDKAATSVADFQEGFRSFGELQKDQIELTAETITVLNHFGASNSSVVETFGILTKTLGKTPEQANKILNDTTAIAQELGRPPAEILSDFTKAMPVLAMYGQKSERMFKDIATQAALLGIDTAKLVTLNQDMDTFEGAAKAAQAFNVAAGGPFLSAQALLAADGKSKLDMVAEAYKKAERRLGPNFLTPRMLRGLSSDLGVSVDELVRVLKLDTSKYKSKALDVQDASATLAENVKKVQENQTAMDKITAQIQRIIDNIIKFTNFDQGLGKAASMLTKFVEYIVGDKDPAAKKQLELKKSLEGKLVQSLGDPTRFVTRERAAREENLARKLNAVENAKLETLTSRVDKVAALEQQGIPRDQAERYLRSGFFEVRSEGFEGVGDAARNMQAALRDRDLLEQFFPSMALQVTRPSVDIGSRQVSMVPTYAGSLVNRKGEYKLEDAMATPMSVRSNYVQPVFNKQDKFYAAKDGGAIANALDEVLTAVDKLIEQKQDVNLDINERKLAQAVDSAFATLNARRV